MVAVAEGMAAAAVVAEERLAGNRITARAARLARTCGLGNADCKG
jgi:hypothetical protein